MIFKEKFFSAAIGTLFFIVFQPFGISSFCLIDKLTILLGLLVVSFVSCLTSEFIVINLARLPLDSSRGPSYTMKRGLVFQMFNVVVLTILLSLYFDRFLNNATIDNHLCIENSLKIFGASVGCCFFIGLYWRNVYWKRHYAKQLEEAQILNGVLMERSRIVSLRKSTDQTVYAFANISNDDVTQRVTLGGSTRESVSLQLSAFLFAESEGNYVSIHQIDNNVVKRTILRTSMKNVVAELCGDKEIMQCHRAYIVNLRHVVSVEGRSSGIGLRLRHCNDVIPVSKSYVNEVKERIKNPV